MSDMNSDSAQRRAGGVSGAGELQRRKALRNSRRTFRPVQLLPVPVTQSGSMSKLGPAVDWPQGHSIEGGEEWQDRPDERDLGEDFAPVPEASAWRARLDQWRAAVRSRKLALVLLASAVLHLCCAAFLFFMPHPETVEIAGGGAVSVMLVGEQAADSLAAGEAKGEETAQPVEQTKVSETDERPVEAQAPEPVADSKLAETAEPEPPAPTPEPAAAPETAATPPVENAVAEAAPAPSVEPTPEPPSEKLAEPVVPPPENVAVAPQTASETGELAKETQTAIVEPTPPAPVETLEKPPEEPVKPPAPIMPPEPLRQKPVAKTEPAPKKVEKPKAGEKKHAARKQAEADKEAKRTPAKTSKGEAGDAKANAQRGASAKSESQTHADPGNAAVSNYPGKVAAKLRRALKYPKSAVSGSRGETRVAFTVQSDGSASGVRVVSSSGSAVLDQAAVDAVKRAAPFPPIPAEAGRKQWPFAVPVLFNR